MPEPTTDSLVERDAELSALTAAAERAVAAEGQLVVVEGPAGIGKTRLLQHLRSAFAAQAGARALTARGTELETHVAFGVVRQLLEPLVFELAEGQRDELFTGAASLARAVLTVGSASSEPSEADRYSQINGLFWLASTLARERPLALVVDDVQWADEPSVEFLGFVARRIEGLPLLVAVATRPVKESPGHLTATLVTDPGATVLRPAPLSGRSVTALVRRAVGADAEDDFASACLEATHGNPFLLSELLREVRAQRVPPTAETARRVGSLAPGGVSAVVELRLAQMPEGARPLAEAVATLGDGAGAAAAAQLAEVEPGAAVAAEEALVRSGILEDRGGLAFTHPVVRATVLHGIPPSSRTRLHATAAAMLRARDAQPEDLATHLLHVEPEADEDTVASLRRAAEKAERLGAPSTAAAYLRRALAEPPSPETRGAVLTELGRAEARAGLAEATGHLRQAISEAADPEARVRAAVELARALKFGGEAVQAVDVFDALAPDLDAVPAELRELVEIEHIGLAYISQGARERLSRRIAELREPPGPARTPLEAFVLAGLAFDAAAGGLRPAGEAADLASRALAGDLIPVDAMEGV